MRRSTVMRWLENLKSSLGQKDDLRQRVRQLEEEVDMLRRMNRKLSFQVEILLFRQMPEAQTDSLVQKRSA